jgi:hypothetical protein
MAVTDDLRAIAEQSNRELDAVRDFYEHSRIVWQSFETLVLAGHRFSATSPATGTQIDQDGLLQLAPRYLAAYLATFTFRQFVSLFEGFLFNFLHRRLLHNPWQFSEKQLDFATVLKSRDRDEVISRLILKHLNELRYEQLREWFVAVNKSVKLDCPTEDEIDQLAEIKALRDILEHNAGVVNEVYLRKSGKKARYQAGDPVEINDTYHLESWKLMKKVIADVTAAAIDKLAK